MLAEPATRLVALSKGIAGKRGIVGGWSSGVLLGLSMLPRAEIALLVARTGNHLGDWAIPDTLYGAVVSAAAMASIASPLVLHPLLRRWGDALRTEPPDAGAGAGS